MKPIGRVLCLAAMHSLRWEFDRAMVVRMDAAPTDFYALRCRRTECRKMLSFTSEPSGFGWRQ